MSANGANIGMMDPAYFVGRGEILSWLSEFLQLSIHKIEETASGAVACQLMDALFPGCIMMSKVDFSARNDYEFIKNYKLLQSAFDKMKITKVRILSSLWLLQMIEVEKLCRGKYQDNFEFMQWMKALFDNNYNSSEPYDAIGRRSRSKGGKDLGSAPRVSAAKISSSNRQPVAAARPLSLQQRSCAPPPPAASSHSSIQRSSVAPSQQRIAVNSNPSASSARAASSLGIASTDRDLINQCTSEVKRLQEELAKARMEKDELSSTAASFESERDFYYNKLRQIELMLQENQINETDDSVVGQVLRILYATGDNEVAEEATNAAYEDDSGVDGDQIEEG